jgi:hypothetical protein
LGPEATQDLLVCFLWVLKNVDQRFLRSWWSDLPPSRLSQLLDILYLCESNFEYKVFTGRETACQLVSVLKAQFVICSHILFVNYEKNSFKIGTFLVFMS